MMYQVSCSARKCCNISPTEHVRVMPMILRISNCPGPLRQRTVRSNGYRLFFVSYELNVCMYGKIHFKLQSDTHYTYAKARNFQIKQCLLKYRAAVNRGVLYDLVLSLQRLKLWFQHEYRNKPNRCCFEHQKKKKYVMFTYPRGIENHVYNLI
jgi:hypothetical protein